MDFKVSGRTVLVTASSDGIGKEIALTLATEGARVIICSRNELHLKNAAIEIKEKTGSVIQYYVVDLTNLESVKQFISSLMLDLKKTKIDILVYNVGGPISGDFDDFTDADWEIVYNSIIRNYVMIVKKLIPKMIENKWGRVVVVASVSVRQPVEDLLLSNVFRPAVAGLNKTLSNKYARFGITFNTVCPGGIYTARIEGVLKKRAEALTNSMEDSKKQYLELIPMRRFGEPVEVANAIAFLVSDCASFITGTCLSIDGGVTKSIF